MALQSKDKLLMMPVTAGIRWTPQSNREISMTQTAFITGAASGIGKATAEALYHRGWSLALADINLVALQQQTEDWDQQRVCCYALDVTNIDQCQQSVNEFVQQHGQQLNLLLNSAGILQIDRFEEISNQRHQQIININITGVINCCQAAFPYLKHTENAVVINMSSASATYGVPMLASYSASKFAVRGLTEGLRIEWEEHGIKVCDVMPPFVNTHMLQSQQSSAPVLEKLGVHIGANDVVSEILKQIEQPKTHRAVSLQFKIAYFFSELLPTRITGGIMRLLHRG